MHNFNIGLLCALTLMLLVSFGNGLKCWVCDDTKAAEAGPFNCNDTSKFKEADKATDYTTLAPPANTPAKKDGCYTLRVEVEAGKWRFKRDGAQLEAAEDGKKRCEELAKTALGTVAPTEKNHNCEFCFENGCNKVDFAAAAGGSTTTGSSVSIRANSFIYCIVIFALFIRKFLSSDLLVKLF